MDEALEGLDPDQRACATAPPGPMVIEAGPGSGKTRVLAARVAHRVQAGTADPARVLVVTFTRQAAGELRQRLARAAVTGPAAGTLHALAYDLVRRFDADQRRPRRRVVPTSRRLLRRASEGLGDVPMDALVGEIEWAAARALPPDAIAPELAASGRGTVVDPGLVAEAAARYARLKRSRGVLDLSDLLLEAMSALGDPVFGPAARWRCAHLLVDEAQDLNPAQWSLIRALVGEEEDLCMIGDPDQAIYGWNGAEAGFLTDFTRWFPSAARFRLRRNYRCPPAVARAASALLGASAQSPVAEPDFDLGAGIPGSVRCCVLEDARQEADFVVRGIGEALADGAALDQLAVLARTNEALEETERALRSAAIPCRGGRRFLDQPAVVEALRRLGTTSASLPAGGCVTELRTVADELRQEAGELGSAPGEREELDAALDQLIDLVAEWARDQPSARGAELADWLAGAVRGRGGEPGPARPAVTLATFHRAKGLEWRRLFVVGAADGLTPLPPPADQAEERRLFYVALTRAEEAVWCTWARHRETRRGLVEAARSPYLDELVACGAASCLGQPEERPSTRPPPISTGEALRRLRHQLEEARSRARHRAIAVPGIGSGGRSTSPA